MQVATQSFTDPPPADGLEHSITLEGVRAPQGYVQCEKMAYSLDDGADAWWVDVPRWCLPEASVTLSVYAQTTPPADDESGVEQWSEDRLRVPGRHRLGGTVLPEG